MACMMVTGAMIKEVCQDFVTFLSALYYLVVRRNVA